MKVLFSFLALLCVTSSPAFAQELFDLWAPGEGIFGKSQEPVPPGMSLVELATLTSDRDQNKDYLNLMVDDKNTVTGMYSKADAGNKGGSGGEGKNVFWLRDIESTNGAVMLTARGRDVLIMQGRLEPVSQEGRFSIRYLANGLTMRYESCEFSLRKDSKGWYVENSYNRRKVDGIKVITHSLGISTLQGLCPEK